ncbi:MAG TPA: hypothetical protein PK347_08585 [Burkholderiaceae bacterium]|nr:hypothetical protein [Burkholderiaceae bacterium]
MTSPRAWLPNEPRVIDAARQQALTEQHLQPAIGALMALMQGIRSSLDPVLRAARPTKWGKPYPLGQCLEISLAVKRRLRELNPATLSGEAAKGHVALAAFLAAGGHMHQVWGDLRGEYFQNAFLAGTLYIDVSNDTVVPTKPPVEILPFDQARLNPVADFAHFARLATRYWQAQVHPNHLLPDLAPYYPLITIIPGVGTQLQADSGYMVALAHAHGFAPSRAVLEATPMDTTLFATLVCALRHEGHCAIPHDAIRGRALALQACDSAAAVGRPLDDSLRQRLGQQIAAVNANLLRTPPQL